jgi:hypothetical protein
VSVAARDVTLVLGGTGFLGAHVVRSVPGAVLSAARGAALAVDATTPALDALLERERPARVIL